MSETPNHQAPVQPDGPAGTQDAADSAAIRPAEQKSRAERKSRAGRKGLVRRIALIAVAGIVAVAGVVALGGFLAVRHLEGNIHRIPNVFNRLTAATRPVMPAATKHSMTILLTASDKLPAHRGGNGILGSSTAPEVASAVISLVHIDANMKGGAIVSIPADAVVRVPGHGREPISRSLAIGGPSLLIATVQQLTGVAIDHYSVVDDAGLASALRPLGGVDVTLPATVTSGGVTFPAGVDHLTSADALAYTEQPSLSEEGHALRQEALFRGVLDKLASENLLGDPASAFRILDGFTKALSVDSNFSNSQLQSLATHLNVLGPGAGTFVTAPDQHGQLLPVDGQLWNAIRNDDVAAFAQQHPAVVDPAAPN
jgi:LCP family protein required for cell wall assembly